MFLGKGPAKDGVIVIAAKDLKMGKCLFEHEAPTQIPRSTLGMTLGLVLVLLLSACRPVQKMANQPKYDPLEPSTFFSGGMSARPRVAGTIPYQGWKKDTVFNAGKAGGQLIDGFPVPVTDDLLARGEERFNIYCSMCHGLAGNGDGMIVQRGYRRPTSFHSPLLRAQKTGHFFDVITNGFGAMPAYGTMIPASDRWAIIAYVRALQLSQYATTADIPPADRAALMSGGNPK